MASWLKNRRPADCQQPYLRARWYDAEVGRWVSEDPLGFGAGDGNLARYVGNSPVILVDPSGLKIPYDAVDVNATPPETGTSQPPRQRTEGTNEKPVDPDNPGVVDETKTPGAVLELRQIRVSLIKPGHAYLALQRNDQQGRELEWNFLHFSPEGYTVETVDMGASVVLDELLVTAEHNDALVEVWAQMHYQNHIRPAFGYQLGPPGFNFNCCWNATLFGYCYTGRVARARY